MKYISSLIGFWLLAAPLAFAQPCQINANSSPASGDTLQICEGETINFSENFQFAMQYDWVWGDGTPDGSGQSTSHTYDVPGPGTNTVIYQTILTTLNPDSSQCMDTVYVAVTNSPELTVQLTKDSECLPDTSSITADSVGFIITAAGYNGTFTVDMGDGTIYTGLLENTLYYHTFNQFQTFTITFTSETPCPGETTATFQFYKSPIADMSIVGTTSICEGTPAEVANQSDSTTVDYYVWDWGDGTRDTVFTNANQLHYYTIDSATVCSGIAQSFIITLEAYNASCNYHFNSSPVTVTPLPDANFTVDTPIVCINDPEVNFFNQSCPPSGVSYLWDFGDGSPTWPFPIPPNPHVYGMIGTYTATLVATNGCGSDTADRVITVRDTPTIVIDIMPDDTNFCQPVDVFFENNSTPANGITWNWQVTTIPFGLSYQFIMGTDNTTKEPHIRFNDAGDYIITLTATNDCGVTIWVDTIEVREPPTVTLSPIPDTCGQMDFFPVSQLNVFYYYGNGNPTFEWTFNSGTPASSTDSIPAGPIVFPPGNHSVQVIITNECGADTATRSFTVDAPTPNDAGPDTAVCIDSGILTLMGTPGGGTWSGPGTTLGMNTFDPLLAGVGVHTVVYTFGEFYCEVMDTIIITVHPEPIVDAGPAIFICQDYPDTLLMGSPAGGTWTGTNVSPGGLFSPTTDGTFVLTYTYLDTMTGCDNFDQTTVTVFPETQVNAGGDTAYCINANLQPLPTPSPLGGIWYDLAGVPLPNQGFWNPNMAGMFTVVYAFTDGNSCIYRDTFEITVTPPDPVDAGPGLTLCVNDPEMQLMGFSPAGGFWFSTVVPGAISPTGGFDPSVSGVGSFEVIYTVGQNDCQVWDTTVVVVNDTPTVVAGPFVELCVDADTLTLSGYSPTANGTGMWSGPGIVDPVAGTFLASTAGVGTHTLTYTFTDLNGCTEDDSRQITVHDLPFVDAGADTTYCVNANLQPLPTPTPPLPLGQWLDGSLMPMPNQGFFDPSTAGTFTIYYTFTDGNSCTNIDSLVVTVMSPTVVEAGPGLTLCVNDPETQLTGFSPAGGNWYSTVVPGAISPTGGFDPSVSGVGSFEVIYTVGQNDCQVWDTTVVVVNDTPTVVAGPFVELCVDADTLTLSGYSPTANGTGMWSGPGIVDPVAGTFLASSAGVGTHTLTYTFTDLNGCTEDDSRLITVHDLPVVDAGADTSYCVNPALQPLPSPSPAGGTWLDGSLMPMPNQGFFDPSTAGTFTIYYTFTDGNSCTNIDSLVVTVMSPTVVEAGPGLTLCVNDPETQLTGFSPAGGNWYSTVVPGAISPTGGFDPSVSGVGSFEVIYTVGQNDCQVWDTTVVVVNDTPTVVAGPFVELCVDADTLTLSGYSPTANGTGMWSGPGIVDPVAGTFLASSAGVGTHTLTYTFTDLNGCTEDDSRLITVHDLPVVDAGADTSYCVNPALQPLPSPSPAGGTWLDGSLMPMPNQGFFDPSTAGTFTIYYTFTDGNSCTNIDSLVVTVMSPTVVEAGPGLTLCVNDPETQLTGFSPAGGNWYSTVVPGAISPTGGFDPSVSGVGSFEVIYTVGQNDCQVWDTTVVVVNDTPTVVAGPFVELCVDADTLTLSGYSPTANGTGMWSGPGIVDPVAGTFLASTAGVGTHTLTYTFTDLNGCTEDDSRLITVHDLPVVDAGADTSYCVNPALQPLPSPSPAGGTWLDGSLMPMPNQGFFDPSTAGIFTIYYTFTDGNSCTNIDSLVVTVMSPTVVEAGPGLTLCVNDPETQLTGFSPAGGNWYSTVVPGAISPTGGFDPSVSGVGSFEVIYTVGQNDCQVWDTTVVVVNDTPTVVAGPFVELCVDADTLTLSGYSPTANGTGMWSGPGIVDPVAGTFLASSAGVGTHTLTYTFTDLNGCTEDDSRLITVHDLPVVDAGADTSYCVNPALQPLPSPSPAGGTWLDGSLMPMPNQGFFDPSTAGTFTIYYTFTDGNSCTNIDSLVVTVMSPTVVEAGPGLTLCVNDPETQLTGFSPAGGNWYSTVVPGAISPTGGFDPSVSGVGSFEVIYTVGQNDCQVWDTTVVVVNDTPTVVAGPFVELCVDADTLTLSGYSPTANGTGMWSGPGIVDPVAGTFLASSAGVGTHTLTYTFTDLNGCTEDDSRLITVHDLPVVDAGADTSYCVNPALQPLPSPSPAGGTWLDGSLMPMPNQGFFDPSTAGTFTIYYTFTDGNSCTNIDSLVVTVMSPTVVEAGPGLTLCVNDPETQLTGFSPAGGNWYSTVVPGAISPTGGFDPSVSGVGSFEVIYTVGQNDCQVWDTTIVVVNDTPLVVAGPDFSICVDADTLTLTGQSPTMNGTWMWSGNGIVDPIAGTWLSGDAGIGTHVLTYTFTDQNGCTETDTRTVLVDPLPFVDAGSDTTYCMNPNLQPLPTPTPPLPQGQWLDDSFTPLPNQGFYDPSTPGMFTLYYHFQDGNGCENLDSLIVTVITPDSVFAGPGDTLCVNSAPTALAGFGPVPGMWFSDQVPGAIDASGVFDPSVSGVGTWEVIYTVGQNDCQVWDTTIVVVNDTPLVVAGPDFSICVDVDTLTLTGQSPTMNGTWLWSGNGIVDPIAGTWLAGDAGIGTHTLTYTFTDLNGCTEDDSRLITVHDLPVVDAGADTSYCVNPALQPLPSPSPAGGTWLDGSLMPMPNQGFFDPSTAGTFTIYYTFTDGNSCTNIDSLVVTVMSPTVVEAGPGLTLCVNDPETQLTGFSPAGGNWYSTVVPGAISPTGGFDPSVSGVGSFEVIYTVGQNDCQVWDTTIVVVNDTPLVVAGPDFSICVDADTLTLTGQSPTMNGTWLWSGNGIVDPVLGTWLAGDAGIGTHVLTYTFTDQNGCTETDTRTVLVDPLPFVDAGSDTTYCMNPNLQPLPTPTPPLPQGQWLDDSFTPLPNQGFYDPSTPGMFTLYYHFQDGNGCENLDSLIVTVITPDSVFAGPGDTLCVNSAPTALAGFGPVPGMWFSDQVPGAIDASGVFDPSVSGVGSFEVIYTVGQNDCQVWDTTIVVVNDTPLVVAGPDFSICVDADTLTLTGQSPTMNGTWMWSGNGIVDPIAGTWLSGDAGIGTHVLTYTFTDQNGCTETDTRTVLVDPLPFVDAGSDTTYCMNPNLQPLPTPTPPLPQGQWLDDSFTPLPNQGFYDPSTPGMFTLYYHFQDGNGCENLDSLIVTVITPDSVFAGPGDTLCVNSAPTALAGFGPVPGMWFSDQVPGAIDASGVFDPSVSGVGTWEVIYTVGQFDCQVWDTTIVVVNDTPLVVAGPDFSICVDADTLTLTGQSPTMNGTWLWSGNGIVDPVLGTWLAGDAGIGTHVLTYTFTDQNGCTETDTRTVQVDPLPTVNAGADTTYCVNPSIQPLPNASPSGGVWTDGVNPLPNQGFFDPSMPGMFTVYYTFQDGNGCENLDSLIVTVITPDSVFAGPGDTLCVNSAPTALAGFGPVPGMWFSDQVPGAIDASGVFDPSVSGVGTWEVIYTVGQFDCQVWDTTIVVVNDTPLVVAGPDFSICVDADTLTLTGQSPTMNGTWMWSGNGIVDPIAGTWLAGDAGIGTHVLTYTFTDQNGCTETDTRTVQVDPLPTVNAGADTTYCVNPSIQPLPNASPSGGVWTDGVNPLPNQGFFDPSMPGMFTVYYTFQDGNGCENLDSLIVTVITPDSVFAGPGDTLCVNSAPTALAGFGPVPGMWFSDQVPGAIDASGVFDPSVSGVGTWEVIYTVGQNDCQVWDTTIVVVNDTPLVVAGPDFSICVDADTLTLMGQSPTANGTWMWSGNGIIDPIAGIWLSGDAGIGVHTLTYTFTDLNGCTENDSRNITVNGLPFVDAGSDTTYCVNPNLQPLPTPTPPLPQGQWLDDTFTPLPNQGFYDPSMAGMFTLYYHFQDANGCENLDSLIVTVITPDSVFAGPGDTLCVNSAPTALAGFGPVPGMWFSDQVPGAIDASGIFDPSVSGVGTWEVIYTVGQFDCQVWDTTIVVVNDTPLVVAGPDFSICVDADTLTLMGQSPTTGGTWMWSGNGIIDPIAGTWLAGDAGVGMHTLTYTFTDLNGCTETDTRIVEVDPLPTVEAGADTSYCINPNPQPLPIATPPGGQWTDENGNVIAGGLYNPVAAGIFTVYYTFTDGNGCVNYDSLFVTVQAPDSVFAGPGDTICVNNAFATLTGFGPPGGTWFDLLNPTAIFNDSLFDPSISGVGTFPVIYTVGANDCQVWDTTYIVVNDTPLVDAGPDLEVCADDPIFTLTGQSPTTGGTGEWTGPGLLFPGSDQIDPGLLASGPNILTYTFTDLNGCTESDTRIITRNELPMVDAGLDTTYCVVPDTQDLPIPSPLPNTQMGGVWSTPNANPGLVDPVNGLFVPSLAGLGNHVVYYTFTDNNGCSNIDSLVVSVIQLDSISAGLDDSVCVNAGIYQLANYFPTTGGVWTGTGIIPGTDTFDPQGPGVLANNSYALVYTFGAGSCTVMDTMIITVLDTPVVEAGPDFSVCVSEPPFDILTGTPTGGIWSGNGITGIMTFNAGIALPGDHLLTYTYTDPITGCVNTDDLTAHVDSLPIVAFDSLDQSCISDTVQFTNLSSGAVDFFWDFGDGATSTLVSPTHVYDTVGTFTIKLIGTGPGPTFCQDSMMQTITVIQPPIVHFGLSDTAGCAVPDSLGAGLWVIFTDSSTAYGGNYFWDFGGGTDLGGNSFSTAINPSPVRFPQGTQDTTYYITLTIQNPCGTVSKTDSVTVFPIPQVDFGPNVNSGCSPLVVQFGNTTVGEPDSFFWYLQDTIFFSNDSIPPAQTLYANQTDSIYKVTLISTNECGMDSMSVFITVHPDTLTGIFNVDTTDGCAPLTVTVTDFSLGALFVAYDFGDGSGDTTAPGASVMHTYIDPGSYEITQYTNNGCAFDTFQTVITVHPQPLIDFSFTDSICAGEVVSFFNQSVDATSFEWAFGDSTFLSQVANPTHIYDTAGLYMVRLIGVSNTFGCPDTAYHDVTILPNPVVDIVPSTIEGCPPLTVSFTNNTITDFHFWQTTDGQSSVIAEPEFVFHNPGDYTVRYLATDVYGCDTWDSLTIRVHEPPISDFTAEPIEHCGAPVDITLTNLSTDTLVSYQWDFGNGTGSTLFEPPLTYQDTGLFLISLITTNTFTCSDTAMQWVRVYATPTALFEGIPDIGCLPHTVQFSALDPLATDWQWNFGDGTEGTGENPVHTYHEAGFYDVELIVSYLGKCPDTMRFSDYIEVLQSPVADFSYTIPPNDPYDGKVIFMNLTQFGNEYEWHFGDGDQSFEEHPTHRYYSNGPKEVMLIAFNELGCSDTIIKTIVPDMFGGLFIPNAFMPGSGIPEYDIFKPVGVGLAEFEISIYTPWGDEVWSSDKLVDGMPAEHWDGTINGTPAPANSDAFVWRVHKAVFEDGTRWQGMQYEDFQRPSRTGTVNLIR